MFNTFLLLFVCAPFWRFFRISLLRSSFVMSSMRVSIRPSLAKTCMYRNVLHTFSAIHLWLQLRWYLRFENSLAFSAHFFLSFLVYIPLRRCTPSLKASWQSAALTCCLASLVGLYLIRIYSYQSANPLCIDCVTTLFTEAKIVISSRVCSLLSSTRCRSKNISDF